MSLVLEIEVPGGQRFELHPTSQILPAGILTENQDVFFHLAISNGSVFHAELEVNDYPLERSALSNSRARWKWNVGFHAGLATARLIGLTPSPLIFEIITDPARAKLTRDEYTKMVGDIISDTLAVASLAGHKIGISKGSFESLGIARFEYLRRCFDEMERSVLQINQSPWLRMERATVPIPLGKTGAGTPLEFNRAMRRAVGTSESDLARLPASTRQLASTTRGMLPRVIHRAVARPDNRRREHADMLGILSMWKSFLLGVKQGLGRLRGDIKSSPQVTKMHGQSLIMLRRLTVMGKLPLFEGVSPTLGPPAASHLFLRVPQYRRFYETYRGFLAGLSRLLGDFVNVPVHRTFDLYELWCFLRLLHAAALDAGTDMGWRDSLQEVGDPSGLLVRIKARPFRFGDFTLLFQPSYREVWKYDGPVVGSFSRNMEPDISFEVNFAGSPCPVVVLDAKYRSESGLNESLASVHMYRDALVHFNADSAIARRLVRAAFILVPHLICSPSAVDWRRERSPAVFLREEYRQMFKFGAILFRPGISIPEVQILLRRILEFSHNGSC